MAPSDRIINAGKYMKTDEKIRQIRHQMQKNGLEAIIIPGDDPHQSEYVADHWQTRKWVTGFSGDAGTAVITQKEAILWTDFRYYIQAENQISDSEFQLFKTGEDKVPSYQKYLSDTLKKGDVVGINADVFSIANVKKNKKAFESAGLVLNLQTDIVNQLWTDRPPMPDARAYSFKYAGRQRTEKINAVRRKMRASEANYHLVATLDDIAWMLNLRGRDVHTNPVNICFVLIVPDAVRLFINHNKIDDGLVSELKKDGVRIFEYADIFQGLSNIEKGSTILIDPENTNFSLLKAIPKDCNVIEKPNPAIALKAVKNSTEINQLRKTAIKDGIAVVSFLQWLEHQDNNEALTETTAARKLYEYRKLQKFFVDNSFDPIMAFQEHSAMCHYSATPQTDMSLNKDGFFLTDSGGHYLTGTTDITRTVFRGQPREQEKREYTLVLKGHICVANAIFPKGTKGFQIDTLSRQFLWENGMDFGHGTGHGVGFFLCVHEGPATISPHPVDVRLETGMVLTNEPGIYREGKYGIRLENMILVSHAFENEFGTFYKFETLTLCHFERKLIDTNLLTDREIEWVNTYHKRVYEKLSPRLDENVSSWLKEKTRPL